MDAAATAGSTAPAGYREIASAVPGAVLWWSWSGSIERSTRVLPDGCVDLIWTGTDLQVAGPDVVAFVTGPPPGSLVAGLRFTPGTGPRALGLRADEAVGQRVPLDALLPGARVARWEADVTAAAARTSRGAHRVPGPAVGLERVARALVDAATPPDELVLAIVAQVRRGRGVAAAARELGASERTLHRRSLPALGYGPATLGRVLRLQRAVGLARRGVPWAQVAARAGFADQAHLTREVHALSGITPTRLVPPASRAP